MSGHFSVLALALALTMRILGCQGEECFEVAIAGMGFAGIAAALKLREVSMQCGRDF
jgi:hypothetical protein